MSKPTFLDILDIYVQHYGKEEIQHRKRHYSASLLVRSTLLRVLHQANRFQSLDQNHMCRRLVMLSQRVEDEPVRIRLPLKFRKCYRNEIYPAEIHDCDSLFFGVHLETIDALLLDRPDDGQPFRVRGRFDEQKERTAWLVEMNNKRKLSVR